MLPTIVKGILTGGFSFLSEWWKGKQEAAQQELRIKQEIVRVDNEIKLKQITAQLDIDAERVRQMDKSWKDEWWLIIFSIPLVNMFLSPFIDLYMAGDYKEGMLATAATQALKNLDTAPTWYIVVILMMTFLSWGYRRGLDQVLGLFNIKKSKQ